MKQDHHKTPNRITCRTPIKVAHHGYKPAAEQEHEQRLLHLKQAMFNQHQMPIHSNCLQH